MNKISKIILINIITLSLYACGFSIQASKSLPTELNNAYLQSSSPFGMVETSFKRRLKSYGIKLADSLQKDSLIINLSSGYSHNFNSTASSAHGRICNLNYIATISVSDNKNKLIITSKTIGTTRDITLQPNEVFATTPQLAIVKKEMTKELTNKIIDILSSHQASLAFEKYKNES